MQCAEIKSPVEAIGERGEIAGCILSKGERMVTPAQAGLEVAQNRVDPLELGQVLRLPSADHGRLVRASGRSDGGEAVQAVGKHCAARGQMCPCPLPDALEAEAGHGRELGAQGMTVGAERDGGHERDFVFRAATSLAAATLTAEVGIIDLDLASEEIVRLAFGHRLHQFVVDKPGGWVAHPQLPHQGECRQSGFSLTDKIDRRGTTRSGAVWYPA